MNVWSHSDKITKLFCYNGPVLVTLHNINTRVFISLACASSETHNLQRVFRRILYTNVGSLCPAFFAETVKTETKNRCVIKAMHVLRRKLRKDYFGTSEHKTKWSKKEIRILISKLKRQWSGVVNFQVNFVMSMRFIFRDDWNDVPCESLSFIPGNDIILWNRGPWIFVYLYTRIT